MTEIPEGVTLNNPFDIMLDPKISWIGQIRPVSGHGLLGFDTAIHGIRAGMKDAHTRVYVDKLDTLELLIPKFDSSLGDDRASYIRNVRTWLMMTPNQKIEIDESGPLIAYARAIVREEVGLNPATDSDWFTNYQYMTAASMALSLS